jgi:N-acetylglucosaminyl-diphospho-decaprenol L-rhamnosyltransferase
MISPTPLTLTVSVINYRTAELTLACIASVLREIEGIAAEIVVLDNCSEDGSAEIIEDWIARQDPQVPVRLLRSPTNSGFSGGHNQAIAASPARFYLLLNSDALLRPGAIRALLEAAKADCVAGLFAPRIETEDGTQLTSCFRVHSPVSELIRGAASGPVTRLLGRYKVSLQVPHPETGIGWASFACILLRGAMVETIGLMDEGYFLYFEDVEYCLRARRAGWHIRHVPEARMVHFRGGSGPVKKLAAKRRRLPEYYYASRTRLFRQAHGRVGPLAANLAWLLGRGIARLRVLAGKPVPPANEREWRDLWINFRAPLHDRREPGR